MNNIVNIRQRSLSYYYFGFFVLLTIYILYNVEKYVIKLIDSLLIREGDIKGEYYKLVLASI